MFIIISTGHQPLFKKGLLTTIVYSDNNKIYYGLEGSIETGGIMIDFLIKKWKIDVWEVD